MSTTQSIGGALVGHPKAGGWAAARFMEAVNRGAKSLSPSMLRTLDTLRHEEWKYFDEALVEEALIQLKGVADLREAGLVRSVSNSLGKTVFAYEKVTFMDVAEVSLFGETRTDNDKVEFQLNNLPLPMIHKDFFIDIRTLTASRNQNEPLDTTQVRTAGRVIAEMEEQLLFQGGPTFGGLPIYGYTTFPGRHTAGYGSGGNWTVANQGTKTGPQILDDLLTMIETLQEDRMFGPYFLYVSRDSGATLENDYNPTFSTKTIRQRLEEVEGISKVQVVDKLPAATVVLVQATMDVTCWVQGEALQTVQWDTSGGMQINFKAFEIGVPLIRNDIQGRTGLFHMS